MLDTNILSDLVKHPGGIVAQKIKQLSSEQRERLCTSVIVAAELHYGVEKRGSMILSERINELLNAIEVLPLPIQVDRLYGKLRASLEKTGRIIGANDMLIAAHALALHAVLVTDNMREFERISDLQLENWLSISSS